MPKLNDKYRRKVFSDLNRAASPCLQAWGLGMVIEFIQKLKIDNNKSQWYN